ncbi:TPA: co-chaperone YbbN, partial [Pasteurella multocida]|nr:co-chaperone YbbN [Pasteurella multocida]
MLTSPHLVEVNAQNLTEILQQSQQIPLVLTFYAPSHQPSVAFMALLERYAEQYQGQFILAKVNCETEQMVAAQFRIQTLPTTYLFKEAQALDAFPGILDEQALQQRLALILPKEDEIKFMQALEWLEAENFEQALPLLKEAWELSAKKNSDIALLYAETYIAMKKVEPAQDILNQIPLQDRDNRWQGLQAQIELLIQAADTPEIQQLQSEFAKNPSPQIALKLALQLHQANRNEEALSLLFDFLKRDLNAENGEIKQQFLAMLTAIGQNDPVSNKY